MAVGCQPPDSLATPSGNVTASQTSHGGSMVLPLEPGYYVASDTPCSRASNSSLWLLRRDGIGGARDFCQFSSIEPVGPRAYRIKETCSDFQGGEPEVRILDYQLEGDRRFIASDQGGIVLDARHCAQSDLPPAWRDTDIRHAQE